MKKNFPVTGVEKHFEKSANILSTTDKKGILTYANEDFTKISGFSTEELIGKNHNLVRHPDMPPAAFADLWETINNRNSWMGIVKNRCKNGDHYWVDAYVTPIIRNGEIDEYQSVRGQPEKEHVERAEKLYKQLSDGKSPWQWRLPTLSLNVKLTAGLTGVLLIVFGLLVFAGSISWEAAALGFGFSALFSAGLSFLLTRPLAKAVSKAKSIYENKVAQWVYTGTLDETGQLLLAMKMLESESRGILGRITDSASLLSTQGNTLVETAASTNQKIMQQQSETDRIVTAINEMAASIQEVAHNAQSTADSTNEVSKKTGQGKQFVLETTEAIQSLTEDMDATVGIIQKLAEDSDSITSVVDIIRGIADQTNLLALNAAIEAARAGEQGRGFSVVADEVRTLAHRTQESTSEIQSMVESLQQASSHAVNAMSGSRLKADGSTEKAQIAVEALDAIADSVEAINDMSTQIASAVLQQSTVSEEINRGITRISDLTNESEEGAMQSGSSGNVMNDLAIHLKELAEQFQIQVQKNR